MKIFLLITILLTGEKNCNEPGGLPFIKATSQAYSGGAAGSGTGTYYTLYFKLPQGSDYQFDSLWVDSARLMFSVKQQQPGNDTLVLQANDYRMRRFPNDQRNLPEPPAAVSFPISSKAVAIAGYFHNGKREYFPVESFIKLKPIYYP